MAKGGKKADDGDRRREVRTPVAGETIVGTLIVPRQRIPVLIFDESSYGLGLVAVNAADLQVGTRATFESSARKVVGRVASVRYMNTLYACIYCIGLEWADEEPF